jgi:hypothetical protein
MEDNYREEAMTTTEINRRFAELAGIPFKSGHESFDYHTRGNWIPDDPDFCTDPRLVLREMKKRSDWGIFYYNILTEKDGYGGKDFRLDLVLDTTGLLALRAIKWMEEKK